MVNGTCRIKCDRPSAREGAASNGLPCTILKGRGTQSW